MSAPQPAPSRTETFPVTTDAVELELQLGAGSVTIELIEGLDHVEVVLEVGAGNWWQQGLSGMLSMFGASGAGGTGGTDRSEIAAATEDVLADTEIAYSAQRGRLVLRAPRAGTSRALALTTQLRAPAGARVLVRSSSARVEVNGVAAQVDASTGSGDVRVSDRADAVDIRTGTGDVRIGELARGGRVRTGSGDITIDAVFGDVDLVSGSGELRLGIGAHTMAQLDVSSGSGTVRSELEVQETVPLAPAEGAVAQVRARTGSGAVLVHGSR